MANCYDVIAAILSAASLLCSIASIGTPNYIVLHDTWWGLWEKCDKHTIQVVCVTIASPGHRLIATRAFAISGAVLAIGSCVAHTAHALVGVYRARLAGVWCGLFASLCGMVAMAVFRSDTHEYEVAQLGFSFWLLVVGWALVMAAAVIPLWSPDYYVTIE